MSNHTSSNNLRPGQRVILSMNGKTYPATVKELQPAGMVDIIRDDRAPNPERRPASALTPLRTNSGAPRALVARLNGAAQEIGGGSGKEAEAAARKEGEKVILADYAAQIPSALQALGLYRLPLAQKADQSRLLSFQSQGVSNNLLLKIMKAAIGKIDNFVTTEGQKHPYVRRDTIGYVDSAGKTQSMRNIFDQAGNDQRTKAEGAIEKFALQYREITAEAQGRVEKFLNAYANLCKSIKIAPVPFPDTIKGMNQEFFGKIYAQLDGLRLSLESDIGADAAYNQAQATRISVLAAVYSLIGSKAQIKKHASSLVLPAAQREAILTFLTKVGFGGFAPSVTEGRKDFADFVALPSRSIVTFNIKNPDFGDINQAEVNKVTESVVRSVEAAFSDAGSPLKRDTSFQVVVTPNRSVSYFRWDNKRPSYPTLPADLAELISPFILVACNFYSVFSKEEITENPALTGNAAEVLYRIAELGTIASKNFVVLPEAMATETLLAKAAALILSGTENDPVFVVLKVRGFNKDGTPYQKPRTEASTVSSSSSEAASGSEGTRGQPKKDSKAARDALTRFKDADEFNKNRALKEERERLQGRSIVNLISQSALKAAYRVVPDPARYPKNAIPKVGPAQTCGNPLDGLAYLIAYGGDQRNVAITLTYGGLAELRSASARGRRNRTGGNDQPDGDGTEGTSATGSERTRSLSSIVTAKKLYEMELWSEGAKRVATADRADPEAEFASSGSAVSAQATLRAEDLNYRMKATGKNALPATSSFETVSVSDIDAFMRDPETIENKLITPAVERLLLEIKGLIGTGAVKFVRLVAQEKAPGFKATMVSPELQTDYSRYPLPRNQSGLERLAMVSRVAFNLNTPILIQKQTKDEQNNVHTEIRQFKITIERDLGRDKFERYFLPYTKEKRGAWAKSNNPFYSFTPEQAGEAQQWFLSDEMLKHLDEKERDAVAQRREDMSCMSVDDLTRVRTLKSSFERYNRTLNTIEYNTKRLGEMGTNERAIPYILRSQLQQLNVSSLIQAEARNESVTVAKLTNITSLYRNTAEDYKLANPIVDSITTVFKSVCVSLDDMRLAIPVDEKGNTSFPSTSETSPGVPYKPATFPATDARPASDYALVAEFLTQEARDQDSVITKMQELMGRSIGIAINSRITKKDRQEDLKALLEDINESIDRAEKSGRGPSEKQVNFRDSLQQDLDSMKDISDADRYYYKTSSEPDSIKSICGVTSGNSRKKSETVFAYYPAFDIENLANWRRILVANMRLKRGQPASLLTSLQTLLAETLMRDAEYFKTYPGVPKEWGAKVEDRFNHAQVAVTALETLRLLSNSHIESWLNKIAEKNDSFQATLTNAKSKGFDLRMLEPYVGILGQEMPSYTLDMKAFLNKSKKFETPLGTMTREKLRQLHAEDKDLYTYVADPRKRDFALNAVSLLPIDPKERAEWLNNFPILSPQEYPTPHDFRLTEVEHTKNVCSLYLNWLKSVQKSKAYLDSVETCISDFEGPGRRAAARRTVTALVDLVELLLTLVVSTPTDIPSTDASQAEDDNNARVQSAMVRLYVQNGCFLRATTRVGLVSFFLADVVPLVGTTTEGLENDLNRNILKIQEDLSRGHPTKEDFTRLTALIAADSNLSAEAKQQLSGHLDGVSKNLEQIEKLTRQADAIELPSQTVDQMQMALERNRKAAIMQAEISDTAAQRMGDALAADILAFVQMRTKGESNLALRLRLAGQDEEEYIDLRNAREDVRIELGELPADIFTKEGTKRKKIAPDAERERNALLQLFREANTAFTQVDRGVDFKLAVYAKSIAEDIYFDLVYDDKMKMKPSIDNNEFLHMLEEEGLFNSIADLTPEEKAKISLIWNRILARAEAESQKSYYEQLGTANQAETKEQIRKLRQGMPDPLRKKIELQNQALGLAEEVTNKTQQIVNRLRQSGQQINRSLAYRIFFLSHRAEIDNKQREVELLQRWYLTAQEERQAYLNEERKFKQQRDAVESELSKQENIYNGIEKKSRDWRSPRLDLFDLLARIGTYLERYPDNFVMSEKDSNILRELIGALPSKRPMLWAEAYSLLAQLSYEDLATLILGLNSLGLNSFVQFRQTLSQRSKPQLTKAAATDIVTEDEAKANINLLHQFAAADDTIQAVAKYREEKNKLVELSRGRILEKSKLVSSEWDKMTAMGVPDKEKKEKIVPLEAEIQRLKTELQRLKAAPLDLEMDTRREDAEAFSKTEREKAYRRIYVLKEQIKLIDSFYEETTRLRSSSIVSPGTITARKNNLDTAKAELNRLKAATWTGVNPVTLEPLRPKQSLTYADLLRLAALQTAGASVYSKGVERAIRQGTAADASLAQQFRAVQQQFLTDRALAVTTGMASFNVTADMRKEKIRIIRTYNPVLFKIVTTFWDSRVNMTRWGDFSQHPDLANAVDALGLYGTMLNMTLQAEALAKDDGATINSYNDLMPYWYKNIDRYCDQYRIMDATNLVRVLVPAWLASLKPAARLARMDDFVAGFFSDPFNMILGKGEYGEIFRIKERALIAMDVVGRIGTSLTTRKNDLEGPEVQVANMSRFDQERRLSHIMRIIEMSFRGWILDTLLPKGKLGGLSDKGLAELKTEYPWALTIYGLKPEDNLRASDIIKHIETNPLIEESIYLLALPFLRDVVKVPSLNQYRTQDMNPGQLFQALLQLSNADLQNLFTSRWRFEATKPDFSRTMMPLRDTIASSYKGTDTMPAWNEKAVMKNSLLRLIDTMLADTTPDKV